MAKNILMHHPSGDGGYEEIHPITKASNVISTDFKSVQDHVDNKSNPHSVTKAQVGLGNVQNFEIATKAEAEAGVSNARFMTPLRVKEAIETLAPGGGGGGGSTVIPEKLITAQPTEYPDGYSTFVSTEPDWVNLIAGGTTKFAVVETFGGADAINTGYWAFTQTVTVMSGQNLLGRLIRTGYEGSWGAWAEIMTSATKGSTPYAIAGGTATAKTVTLSPAPTAYFEGMGISFKNNSDNTGAVTLNVNGLGAKSILKSNGNALSSGNLKANSIYTVRYNGTAFILQGEGGEYGTAVASDVLTGKTIGTDSGIVTGTMTNRAGTTQTMGGNDATNDGVRQHPTASDYGQVLIKTPQSGYYDQTSVLQINLLNLIASNIKKGVRVGRADGGRDSIVGTLEPYPTELNVSRLGSLQLKTVWTTTLTEVNRLASHGEYFYSAWTSTPRVIRKHNTSNGAVVGTYTHGYIMWAIDVTPDGQFVYAVAGDSTSNSARVVLKIRTSNMTLVWSYTLSTLFLCDFRHLACDSQGNVFVAGSFYSNLSSDAVGRVYRVKADGTGLLATTDFSTYSDVNTRHIVFNKEKKYLVIGYSYSGNNYVDVIRYSESLTNGTSHRISNYADFINSLRTQGDYLYVSYDGWLGIVNINNMTRTDTVFLNGISYFELLGDTVAMPTYASSTAETTLSLYNLSNKVTYHSFKLPNRYFIVSTRLDTGRIVYFDQRNGALVCLDIIQNILGV